MGLSALRKADAIHQFVQDTEIWSLNNAYMMFPDLRGHYNRFFEIHAYNYLKTWKAGQIAGEEVDHFQTLENLDCPIFVTETLPKIRRQHKLPCVDIVKHFGPSAEYKGSPSWMMALALWEHDSGDSVEYIQSYGIDTSDPGHVNQRQSWAQWIVRAEHRGIEIGGTAAEFRNDPEKDDGLRGLLELTRKQIEA